MKSSSDAPQALPPAPPAHDEALREVRTILYRSAYGDVEFNELLASYNSVRDLVDKMYDIFAVESAHSGAPNWRLLRHMTWLLAEHGRYAEAKFFCDLWGRERKDAEYWTRAAVLACHQGNHTHWHDVREEAASRNVRADVLLLIELVGLVTFGQARAAVPRARELLSTLLPGQREPTVQLVLEDIAIESADGRLLLEIAEVLPLDPPPRSRRAGYMTYLLRKTLVEVLRARRLALLGDST